MINVNDRTKMMVMVYGEVCKRAVAARILGCAPSTVNRMIEDGRLDAACEGTMVDVRSIARYIAAPKQEDFEARKRRTMKKNGSKYAV